MHRRFRYFPPLVTAKRLRAKGVAIAALFVLTLSQIARADQMELIAKDCAAGWPDDIGKQKSCIKEQREAVVQFITLFDKTKASGDKRLLYAIVDCVNGSKNANTLDYRKVVGCSKFEMSAKRQRAAKKSELSRDEENHRRAMMEAVLAEFEEAERREANRPKLFEYATGVWTCPSGYVPRGGKCYGFDEPAPKFEMGR